MKYPKLVESLSYKKINEFSWIITEKSSGNSELFDLDEFMFMSQLDGKSDPYKIAPNGWSNKDIELFLKFLQNNSYIDKKIKKSGLLSVSIRLFKIKATIKIRIICLILNCLLLLSFIPVFSIGCVLFIKNYHYIDNNYNYTYLFLGLVLGLILGIILHECGHAICGLSYGKAKVYEAGIIIGLKPCAYVAINTSNLKERRRKIQIIVGGIEMNLLISGISLILLYLLPKFSLFFYGIGIDNFLLASFNLLLIDGLDGAAILDELLGTYDLFSSSIDFITNKKMRENLLSQGVTGYAKLFALIIISLFQLSYPVLLLLNVFLWMELF